ncbi:MAG: hypothetical protein K2P81_09125 [Bacteriovoracaceae bacterium]|nr:hypothetical protein [Bacteriovoracaceae bacterium]
MSKFLFILIFFISGCGLQRLAVSQLDQLIEIQTASKLDLYWKQKEALERDINLFLKEQQKQSGETLVLVKKIDPTQTQEFDQWWNTLASTYQRVAEEYSKILAKYLALIDSKQKKNFISKINEENEELREKSDHLRVDQLEERITFFFGDINPQQKEAINKYFPIWKKRNLERINRRVKLAEELSKPQTEKSYFELFQNYQTESLKDPTPIIHFLKSICQPLNADQIKFFLEKKKQGVELIEAFQQAHY